MNSKMRNGRRLIIVVLILSLVMINICFSFGDDQTKTLRPKKIVSVLYDDSASMHMSGNPSWSYANYAMQAFAGLMNDNDTLMLTYMSEPGKIIRSGDKNGLLGDFKEERQKTVDNLRKNIDGGGITPFSAVDTACQALIAEKDSNSSTQYWLVVITDGAFEKEPGNENTEASKEEIEEKLGKYAASKMPNGSDMKIMYMAIGDEAVIPDENENITVKKSNATDIIDTLSGIADEISGRYRLEEDSLKIRDGNILELSSKVPLLNIQILTQNVDASVDAAEMKEGGDLAVKSIGIASPERIDERNSGNKLYGNISTITSGGDYIDEGDYTIHFDKKITKDDIVVLYEVALETRMTITKNGKEVKDVSVLRQGDVIDISCDVVKMGTGEKIDLSLLPGDMYQGFTLTVDEGGTRVIDTDEFKYEDYKVGTEETEITATANLVGFAPLVKREAFQPRMPVVYGIKVAGEDPEIPKNELKGSESEFGGVEFIVTGDGEPLSKAEIESIIDKESIKIDHRGDETPVEFEYQVLDNGTLKVMPEASWVQRWILGYFTIPTGQYDVTVTVDEKTAAVGNFSVEQYTLWHVVISLILLALLIWIIGWLVKKKFPMAAVEKATFVIDYDEHRRPQIRSTDRVSRKKTMLSPFIQFFKPYKACRKKVSGSDLVLIAGGRSKIYIDDRWCLKNKGHYLFGDIPATITEEEMERAAGEAYKMIKDEMGAEPTKGKNVKFDRQRILYVVKENVIASYRITKRK